jgi:hypothetical protein
MVDFSNIPHDVLTAWIFWLLIIVMILLIADIIIHLLGG